MAIEAPADGRDGISHPAGDSPSFIRAFLDIEGDHWVAIATDYTIIGVGDSSDQAAHRMLELLDEYLRLCHEEGKTLDEARRPISAKWRLELRARAAVWSVLRRLNRARRARDVEVMIPRGSHLAGF